MKIKPTKNLTPFFLAVTLVLFGLFLTAKNASAYTCAWDGSASTAWATADNWSDCNSTIPQTTDDVVINTATANQPILDLTGGKTINSLSIGSSAVSTLTLSNGLVDINVNKLTITNNLTIGGSGTITSTVNTTAQTHSVNMTVGGNVDIASGGKIDVAGKGLSGGAGAVAGANGSAGNAVGAGGGAGGAKSAANTTNYAGGGGGGGGYGGVGSVGQSVYGAGGAGGIEYGQADISQPVTLGSGGGGGGSGYGFNGFGSSYLPGADGGSGGGVIILNISGILTLNSSGIITADGNNGLGMPGSFLDVCGAGGGGSGGSIWIQAGMIIGAGIIRANGGSGSAIGIDSGGGAGGRISITGYSSDSSIKQVFGGNGNQYGSAGSVYTKSSSATYGDLTFDNNTQNSPSTRTITSAYSTQKNFNNLTFKEGSAGFTISTGAELNIYGQIISSSDNAFVTAFSNAGTFTQNSVTHTSLTFAGTFANSNIFTANSLINLTFSGNGANANTGIITMNALTTLNYNAGNNTNSGSFVAPSLINFNINGSTVTTDTLYVDSGGGNYVCSGTSRYVLPLTYSMNIFSSGTVNHTANPAGIIPMYCLNLSMANLNIDGTSKIDVAGRGLSGGSGAVGDANGTAGNIAGAGGGGGGMKGYGNFTYPNAGGGGGGGYGGVGGAGQSGYGAGGTGGVENSQVNIYQPIALGSGGGGGGSGYYCSLGCGMGIGADGGSGGGAIKLNISGTLTLNLGGFITANGNNGLAAAYASGGDGGGGSGGSIWISAGIITGTGTIRANGGNGNTAGIDGGGGGGGRIAIHGTGAGILTPTATGGTGYQSGANGSVYYDITGSYTSQVMDFTTAKDFTTINFITSNVVAGTSTLTIDIKAGNTPTPDASWTNNNTWTTNIASEASLDAFDNYQYIQYRVNLSSTNAAELPKPYNKPTANPTLQDISFNYLNYNDGALISSPYNTNDAANTLAALTWTQTAISTSTAHIKFQLRTTRDNSLATGTPDTALWTDWLGPDGTNTTYFDYNSAGCNPNDTTINCTINPGIVLGDHADDQWMQYKAYLVSTDGQGTPFLNSVTLTYVVNANPEFQSAPDATPTATSTVAINYAVRDPDTNTGSNTQYEILPTFEYSLDNGSNWTNATSTCFQAGDWEAKAVDTTDYNNYTAVWTPACEAGILHAVSTSTAMIRVTANDSEAANNTTSTTTNIFILDTTSPLPAALPILIDAKEASSTTANLTISATDDSSFEMRIGLATTTEDGSWQTYNISATSSLVSNPDTVYIQFRDAYGNLSAIRSVTTPNSPTNVIIQDTSNVTYEPNEYRLFLAWKALVAEPGPGFNRYIIYRSSDNITYSERTYITDMSLNYYGDSDVNNTDTYYYRITVKDDNGNESFYSSYVYGVANGAQDAGEGGGGSPNIPPIITNVDVATSTIYTSQATITWDTDTLSNSTVNYSAQAGVFTDQLGLTTLMNHDPIIYEDGAYGHHSVTLRNLVASTTYYFQVQSMDKDGNIATSTSGEYGYTFTTTPGPGIKYVAISETTNYSATINWTTDLPSTSVVAYSINSDLSEATVLNGSNDLITNHSVRIGDGSSENGLAQGTAYYFQVQSSTSANPDEGYTDIDNNGGSFYSFTTTVDTTAPVITFNQTTDITNITDTTARISWTTDDSATSTLEYGTDTNYASSTLSNANFNTNHIFELTNLTKGTTYYVRLKSSDINYNPAINQGSYFTTTDSTDYTAPTITFNQNTDISNLTDTSARITFNTNEAATSTLSYGIDTSYGQIASSTYLNTYHVYDLTGLTASTTYHFQLGAADSNHNTATSSDYTFTTIDATDYTAPTISNISSPQVFDTVAVITWTTDKIATSRVDYGTQTNTYTANSSSADLNTAHSISLTSLTPNTKYYYRVYSANSAGYGATSTTEYDFTTLETLSEESEVVEREEAARTSVTTSGGGGVLVIDKTDKVAPVISDIQVSKLGSDSATVNWKTDEEATSITNYQLRITNGNEEWNSVNNLNSLTSLIKSHTVKLRGLQENSVYNYQVASQDSSGNLATSDPLSFTTLSIIEDLTQNNDKELTYEEIQKLTGEKKEEAQKTTLASLLSAANDATQKAASLIKEFGSSLMLGDLEKTLLSQEESLRLLSSNLPAPILSGEPKVITTANTATIAWRTNKPANSLIAISPDGSFKIADNSKEGSYLQVIGNPSEYKEEHVVTIYELSPNTNYHYQLRSQAAVGPIAKSDDFTFKTQSELIDITNHTVEIISPEKAVFKWVTNVESDSTLKYTPYRNDQLSQDETKTKYEKISANIHEITLEDLESGIVYQIELISVDAGKNQANNIINNFTTASDDLPPIISQVQTKSAISPGKETKVQTIISWLTNELSTSRVYYQEGIAKSDQTLANSTTPDNSYAKKHIAVLTNFTPGKVYSFRVESIDSGGNSSISNIFTILAPREQESVFQIIMRNMEEIFGWVGKMR